MKSMHKTQALALTAILFALPFFAHADDISSRLRGISRVSFSQTQPAPTGSVQTPQINQNVQGNNNNGGTNSGNGGNGGNASNGGLVNAGSVVSNATALNAINTTIVRITLR